VYWRRPGDLFDLATGWRLLVLGGTVFLGRHLVAAALGRGHDVTIFNRGRSHPDLYPQVEHLGGDRDGGLESLRHRSWDAVVDTSGFVPRVVRESAELLRDSVGLYAFISTGSVYPLQGDDKSEDGPVIRLEDPAIEDVNQHYGGLKALCEEVVVGLYGDRALNVRSGLIVGPFDPTGRFTYWTLRMARGGDVLAPGAPERLVQFIDARDQSDWILDMAEAGRGGTFNVSGPRPPVALGEVLSACGEATPTWVRDDFLLEQGVRPYSELPLWVPPSAGTLMMPLDRVAATGLRYRDLAVTIRDTREWAQSGAPVSATDAGGRVRQPATLTPEREAQLLALWRERLG